MLAPLQEIVFTKYASFWGKGYFAAIGKWRSCHFLTLPTVHLLKYIKKGKDRDKKLILFRV